MKNSPPKAPKTTPNRAPIGGFFVASEKIRANELSNSDFVMISGAYYGDFRAKMLGFGPDLGYVFDQIPRMRNERTEQR